jgi:hypothetical protein
MFTVFRLAARALTNIRERATPTPVGAERERNVSGGKAAFDRTTKTVR